MKYYLSILALCVMIGCDDSDTNVTDGEREPMLDAGTDRPVTDIFVVNPDPVPMMDGGVEPMPASLLH